MAELFGVDAYSPREVAERVENVGVTKARLPALATFTLAVLAGGFIGLGALYFTLVTSDARLSFALVRTLGGLCFSLGLILVVIAGAELFTGNNLPVRQPDRFVTAAPASLHPGASRLALFAGSSHARARGRPLLGACPGKVPLADGAPRPGRSRAASSPTLALGAWPTMGRTGETAHEARA